MMDRAKTVAGQGKGKPNESILGLDSSQRCLDEKEGTQHIGLSGSLSYN
jgi:hypothetical protein